MGLQNSAQSFQRLLQEVIGDMDNVFCYLDDLLVYNVSEEDHLKTLRELFTRLDKAGLTIALDKCLFGKSELTYLGYSVNSSGLRPVQKKVEVLQRFPVPTKQKELLAFLGALNYYRASLPHLSASESKNPPVDADTTSPAEVLEPLYKLATCKLSKTKLSTD